MTNVFTSRHFLLLALLLLISACESGSNTATPLPNPELPEPLMVLQLVNQARSQARECGNERYESVPAVQWSEALAQAALLHSQDMDQQKFFSHTGSNGSNPGDRISTQDYAWLGWAENIAHGQTSAQQVMNSWLQSPGHCANIMHPDMQAMGLGLYGNYWTQKFALPR